MTTIPFSVNTGPLESGSRPIGYVWFTPWSSDERNIYEMHLCVDPEWHGKWLTPKVLVGLVGHAYIDLQADRILAMHTDPTMRAVLRRIGFESHGTFVNTLDMENPNGILERFIRRWR